MAADIPLLLKATASLYLECAQKAVVGLYKNWLLVVASVAGYFIFVVAQRLFAPFGIAGGFIVGAIAVALLALYYSWISETVHDRRLAFRELYNFDMGLFFQVMSVAFIFFVADLLLANLLHGIDNTWLRPCIQLGIVIIFNAIPEVLQQHRFDSLHALGHAATFTRENWIEWFLPLLLLVAPVLFIYPAYYVLLIVASTEPLLPILIIIDSWKLLTIHLGVILLPLAIILGNWFMLFRSHLFNALESGTRRKRVYQVKGW